MKSTTRWKVSMDYGRTFAYYSSLALVAPVLEEMGISASASRLYNEAYDAYCRARGITTPKRRVVLAPRVVIYRIT